MIEELTCSCVKSLKFERLVDFVHRSTPQTNPAVLLARTTAPVLPSPEVTLRKVNRIKVTHPARKVDPDNSKKVVDKAILSSEKETVCLSGQRELR